VNSTQEVRRFRKIVTVIGLAVPQRLLYDRVRGRTRICVSVQDIFDCHQAVKFKRLSRYYNISAPTVFMSSAHIGCPVQPLRPQQSVGSQGMDSDNGHTWSDTEKSHLSVTELPPCTSSSEKIPSVANMEGMHVLLEWRFFCHSPVFTVEDASPSPRDVERPATPSAKEALVAHPVLPSTLPATPQTPRRKRPVSSYLSFSSTMDFDLEAKAEAAVPTEWKPTRNELLVMVSLSFISLMVALDATVLVTVLPEIAHSLNGTSAEAFWAGTA
jgi:hypothetical protein